jgi:ABC-type polysaccharide/polyol phosphate export permease
LQTIVRVNPIALFVEGLRALIYDLKVPDLWTWLGMLVWSAGALLLAVLVYRSRGLDIGEAI